MLSFISPPPASPQFLLSTPGCLVTPASSSPVGSPLFFSASANNLALSSLTEPTVTYQPQPPSLPSRHSSILLFLTPLCSGYMLTVTHLPSSPLPSLLQLYSTPFLFSSPLASLYLALSRFAAHNDGPVFPPVCQPFTCILATTSPLALMLHAEQANKTPGE